MEQAKLVSGFSELKDFLIKTFQLDQPREKVMLHFTKKGDQLFMHDYHNHKNYIVIANSITQHLIPHDLPENVRVICRKAVEQPDPLSFLNDGFLLYGYFRF